MIENVQKYEAAIERNIRNNANKTRFKKMMETDTGKRAYDILTEQGEFAPKFEIDGVIYSADQIDDYCWGDKKITHPMVAALGSFHQKMLDVIHLWGGLTEGQAAAVVRIATENAEKRKERAAAWREADLKSQHIGAVGERREFEIICNKVLAFEGRYGFTYFNICKQGDDVVIYKGSNRFEEDETIRVKATIKAHEERDGIAQTIISRPKEI